MKIDYYENKFSETESVLKSVSDLHSTLNFEVDHANVNQDCSQQLNSGSKLQKEYTLGKSMRESNKFDSMSVSSTDSKQIPLSHSVTSSKSISKELDCMLKDHSDAMQRLDYNDELKECESTIGYNYPFFEKNYAENIENHYKKQHTVETSWGGDDE